MGVEKTILKEGNGTDRPSVGDYIDMHYTGWLQDKNGNPADYFKGKEFDSSHKRPGVFNCQIGVGSLIKGWDEGVPTMSLGEKAILTITPDYGYGARGAGGLIPPNATLVFEVSLEKIYR